MGRGSSSPSSVPTPTQGSLESAIARRDSWQAVNVFASALGSSRAVSADQDHLPSSPEVSSTSSAGKRDSHCTLYGGIVVVHYAVHEAFRCERCDEFVHGANLLASQHQRA